MKPNLSTVIFNASKADGKSVAVGYQASTAKDLGLHECWFQEAIAASPELVINPCRSHDMTDEDWFFWGREVKVPGIGPIDVLLVSGSGRVAVVETKLAHSPENRRKVLAQVLDYAVNLPGMSLGDFPELPGDVDGEDVELCLAEGNFLLIIAADQVDERAARLSDAMLGDHMVNPWDLALVDIIPYVPVDSDLHDIFLVSALRRAVVTETRRIVRIKIPESSGGSAEVLISAPEDTEPERKIKRPSALTYKEFMGHLSKVDGDVAITTGAFVQNLLRRCSFLEVHMTSNRLRLRNAPGTRRAGRKPAVYVDIYSSGHIFCPGKNLEGMEQVAKDLEEYCSRLRDIDNKLTPVLQGSGPAKKRIGANCAVLGDVMKRIGEIEELIVEMATWFQEQIKRFG